MHSAIGDLPEREWLVGDVAAYGAAPRLGRVVAVTASVLVLAELGTGQRFAAERSAVRSPRPEELTEHPGGASLIT